MVKFTTEFQKIKNSLGWNKIIHVPSEIGDFFRKTDKRVICRINESYSWHCALMPDGSGEFYIVLNNDIIKKTKIESGEKIEVILEKDTSKYGMAVPNFFEELCYQDPEASNFFHDLTLGKQRTLLHIITKLKSEEKQLEKILIIFDYLKENQGNLDFKGLNEAFKTSRFKR